MNKKYTCIASVEDVDVKTRKVIAFLIDGDQWSNPLTIVIPNKCSLPTPVNDSDFLTKYGRLPKPIDTCHIKIGYDYATVNTSNGKFKLHNPVYCGEVKAKSSTSLTVLKRKPRK